MKKSTSQEEICSAFFKHQEDHNDVHIYADGSNIEKQVGLAAVLPAQMLIGSLPGAASIFSVEMYAVKTGS